ncbi:Lanthionine synthetase C-like protein [Actinopolymorpha cephalotaxi]|uniref:Lanthionine synthetase C-like protein n=1 Tax=Actinopolymorpha cephalotaxi TaxID=504797 RepID=A0A1I3C4R2_9ACTN|nr:Lanthionine synthetase C-like protein [Actinopolymorpha cephalotaxi]
MAVEVAGTIASRLAHLPTLERAVAAMVEQSSFPPSVGWRPTSVAAGLPGMAVVFAAFDVHEPEAGWDRLGHRALSQAVAAMPERAEPGASLFAGWAGVGFAATSLARGRGRYTRLLHTVDTKLQARTRNAIRRLDAAHGCGVSEFDVISGLAGVGAYLLRRRESAESADLLGEVLRCLSELLADEGEPRRWHTPADLVGHAMTGAYPDGNHNCGLAHGVTGPLALLAIALREGLKVERAEQAVDVAAEWLADHAMADGWGPNWPNAVPLPPRPGSRPDGTGLAHGRATWCYGAPGIARALWLAGTALDADRYRHLAVEAMLAVLARPAAQRGITSPTFCHGTAGLAHITRRFAVDTGRSEFAAGAEELVRELLAAYEPDSVLGYRNVEPGDVRVDNPGLLDGAPGVALALLAAGTDDEPAWDRLFLLS